MKLTMLAQNVMGSFSFMRPSDSQISFKNDKAYRPLLKHRIRLRAQVFEGAGLSAA
jgi:hypothetical protein